MKKEYVFYGNESGEIFRESDVVKFYKKMIETKKFDRKQKIEDTYFIELHKEIENEIHIYNIKMYVRNRKVYAKLK